MHPKLCPDKTYNAMNTLQNNNYFDESIHHQSMFFTFFLNFNIYVNPSLDAEYIDQSIINVYSYRKRYYNAMNTLQNDNIYTYIYKLKKKLMTDDYNCFPFSNEIYFDHYNTMFVDFSFIVSLLWQAVPRTASFFSPKICLHGLYGLNLSTIISESLHYIESQ
jgi:hypothetical protein